MDELLNTFPDDGPPIRFLKEVSKKFPFGSGAHFFDDLTMRFQYTIRPLQMESVTDLKLAMKHSLRYQAAHKSYLYCKADMPVDLRMKSERLQAELQREGKYSYTVTQTQEYYDSLRRPASISQQYFQAKGDIKPEFLSRLSDKMKLDMRWISLWNPLNLACMTMELLTDLFNYVEDSDLKKVSLFPGLDNALKDGWSMKTVVDLDLQDKSLLDRMFSFEVAIPEKKSEEVRMPDGFEQTQNSLGFLKQVEGKTCYETRSIPLLDLLACLFSYSTKHLHEESLQDLVSATSFLLNKPTRLAFADQVNKFGYRQTNFMLKMEKLVNELNSSTLNDGYKSSEGKKQRFAFQDAKTYLRSLDSFTVVDMRWVCMWNPQKLEEMSSTTLRNLREHCEHFFKERSSRLFTGVVSSLGWTKDHTAEVIDLFDQLSPLLDLPDIGHINCSEQTADDEVPQEYPYGYRPLMYSGLEQLIFKYGKLAFLLNITDDARMKMREKCPFKHIKLIELLPNLLLNLYRMRNVEEEENKKYDANNLDDPEVARSHEEELISYNERRMWPANLPEQFVLPNPSWERACFEGSLSFARHLAWCDFDSLQKVRWLLRTEKTLLKNIDKVKFERVYYQSKTVDVKDTEWPLSFQHEEEYYKMFGDECDLVCDIDIALKRCKEACDSLILGSENFLKTLACNDRVALFYLRRNFPYTQFLADLSPSILFAGWYYIVFKENNRIFEKGVTVKDVQNSQGWKQIWDREMKHICGTDAPLVDDPKKREQMQHALSVGDKREFLSYVNESILKMMVFYAHDRYDCALIDLNEPTLLRIFNACSTNNTAELSMFGENFIWNSNLFNGEVFALRNREDKKTNRILHAFQRIPIVSSFVRPAVDSSQKANASQLELMCLEDLKTLRHIANSHSCRGIRLDDLYSTTFLKFVNKLKELRNMEKSLEMERDEERKRAREGRYERAEAIREKKPRQNFDELLDVQGWKVIPSYGNVVLTYEDYNEVVGYWREDIIIKPGDIKPEKNPLPNYDAIKEIMDAEGELEPIIKTYIDIKDKWGIRDLIWQEQFIRFPKSLHRLAHMPDDWWKLCVYWLKEAEEEAKIRPRILSWAEIVRLDDLATDTKPVDLQDYMEMMKPVYINRCPRIRPEYLAYLLENSNRTIFQICREFLGRFHFRIVVDSSEILEVIAGMSPTKLAVMYRFYYAEPRYTANGWTASVRIPPLPKQLCIHCFIRGSHFTDTCIHAYTSEMRKSGLDAHKTCRQCGLWGECTTPNKHDEGSFSCLGCKANHKGHMCDASTKWAQEYLQCFTEIRLLTKATMGTFDEGFMVQLYYGIVTFFRQTKRMLSTKRGIYRRNLTAGDEKRFYKDGKVVELELATPRNPKKWPITAHSPPPTPQKVFRLFSSSYNK